MNDLCDFRVRKQVVNIPSYIVRLDSQKHIDFSLNSPYGGGRPGMHFVNTLKPYTVISVAVKMAILYEK